TPHSHRHPISHRHNRREEVARSVKLTIELLDRPRAGFGWLALDDTSAPKHVIRYKQSTLLDPGRNQSQDAWIVFLINVIEDDIEFLLLLRKQLDRVPNVNLDAVGNSSTLKVAPRFLGILGIAVGVVHLP